MGKLNPKQIKWLKEAKKRGEDVSIPHEERWHPDVKKEEDEDIVTGIAKDIVTGKDIADVKDIVRRVKRNRETDASRQKEHADEWADRAESDRHEREVINKQLDRLIARAKRLEDAGKPVYPLSYNKKAEAKRNKVRAKVRKEEW